MMDSLFEIFSRELFQTLFVLYLVLNITEIIQNGSVSSFFDMRILLVLLLVCGFLSLVSNPFKRKSNRKNMVYSLLSCFESWDESQPKWRWKITFVISIVGGLIVYHKSQAMGYVSVLLFAGAFFFIFVLSYLTFHHSE